jgi:uncharacterized protein YndB with AHSA1/START domain
MPKVSRSRLIDAPVDAIWEMISDPYHLPRWWPRTQRVENVRRGRSGRRNHWTTVLETESGRPVRADYRSISAARNERYVWEQQLGDTPFDRVLRSAVTEIDLEPRDSATKVSITLRQRLRGLSRLGSPMMRRGSTRMVDDALDGLERAIASPLGREDEE